MPPQIVSAYLRFHRKLEVYNGIAGGLGKAYHKECSIPQGCPLSMMIIALMLRPWMLQMLATIPSPLAYPRLLADDMLLYAVGETHFSFFLTAVSAANQYLMDMGAAIATDKSKLFSNDQPIRQWLRNFKWYTINGRCIDTITDWRDLGAHLSVGARRVATSLNGRLQQGIRSVAKAIFLPFDSTKKEHVLSIIYSAALYGCEALWPTSNFSRSFLRPLVVLVSLFLVVGPKAFVLV